MKLTVYFDNLQGKYPVTFRLKRLIRKTVKAALFYEQFAFPTEVSVTFTDNTGIRTLNREHRELDRETDVLSFPVVNLLDGSDCDEAGDYYEGRLILGDVVLCAERAQQQAEEFGHSIEREMGYLTCHSVLHLIGYDHEDESERETMRQKEEAVMELVNLKR